MKTLKKILQHVLFSAQLRLGLNEMEFKAALLIAVMLIAGAGIRFSRKYRPRYDQSDYAVIDSVFRRLTARADSFDAALIAGVNEKNVSFPGTDSTAANDSLRLDVNSATREELMTLKGVGPAMADRIIEMRKRLTRFEVVSDLRLVAGIGKKTLEKLRPHVRVVSDVDSLD
jgi:competence ComEA-like helix-hairpin-helix protein